MTFDDWNHHNHRTLDTIRSGYGMILIPAITERLTLNCLKIYNAKSTSNEAGGLLRRSVTRDGKCRIEVDPMYRRFHVVNVYLTSTST
jgi:hypothetical protein